MLAIQRCFLPELLVFLTEQKAKEAVSQAVIEAQARLLAMRAEHQQSAAGRRNDHAGLSIDRAPKSAIKQITRSDEASWEAYRAVDELPEHLGWGSQRLSQALRQSLHNQHHFQRENSGSSMRGLDWLHGLQPPAPEPEPTEPEKDFVGIGTSSPANNPWPTLSLAEVALETVKLHPDIGLGILRKKVAAAGRIWLLLRWIDRTGCGWSDIEQVRKLLCDQESSIKVCGWRQMRSLIAQGEGIFWNQRDGRLWLQSIPKVARTLDIARLSGRPVALPLKVLIQGMGQVRAHFFASFHSGRKQANPIARASLSEISHVSPRSQQNYERRARVRKLKNFAVGPKISSENAKDRAWQQGSACFRWHDNKAVHGAQGRSYLAWQLPNSYLGPHKQRPYGRQKKFNRELAVLFTKGMTGNDHFNVELKPKRYFDAAKQTVRNHDPSQTGVYWRGKNPGLWYFMEAIGQS